MEIKMSSFCLFGAKRRHDHHFMWATASARTHIHRLLFRLDRCIQWQWSVSHVVIYLFFYFTIDRTLPSSPVFPFHLLLTLYWLLITFLNMNAEYAYVHKTSKAFIDSNAISALFESCLQWLNITFLHCF